VQTLLALMLVAWRPARGEDIAWEQTFAAAAQSPEFPRTWQWTPDATFQLRGRIDTDFIATSQSSANTATFGELGDDVGLRRARIGGQGELGSWGRYIAEIDLASGQVVPRDVFVGFGQVNEFGECRGGHFREPFSLEGGTSANSFAFLERSPVNLLDPARSWGGGFYRASTSDVSTLALGVFHAGTGPADFQSGQGSTIGFTGRLTAAPINEGNGERLLHLGFSLSERIPETSVIIVTQRPRNPLLNLGDSSSGSFVPEIRIPASFQQLANLQCAWAAGPLWAQAEWYGSWIDQTGMDNVFFHGGYAACGYFVTGEHRAYRSSDRAFGAVEVDRPMFVQRCSDEREQGWGAWELTARFAALDFMDPDMPVGPAGQRVGISVSTATFGVNWYLTDNVRLLFNYTYEVPDEPNTGASTGNIYAMRLNVYW
jgi:phosphate-selective porin OprO and OprP